MGWAIADEDRYKPRHLTLEKREARFFRLWVHVPRLVDDTVKAINRYCRDLRTEGERSRFFSRFKRGYIGTASVFQEPPPPSKPAPKPKTSKPTGKYKNQERLTLKHYSMSGINWIRNEIATGNAWTEKE